MLGVVLGLLSMASCASDTAKEAPDGLSTSESSVSPHDEAKRLALQDDLVEKGECSGSDNCCISGRVTVRCTGGFSNCMADVQPQINCSF